MDPNRESYILNVDEDFTQGGSAVFEAASSLLMRPVFSRNITQSNKKLSRPMTSNEQNGILADETQIEQMRSSGSNHSGLTPSHSNIERNSTRTVIFGLKQSQRSSNNQKSDK